MEHLGNNQQQEEQDEQDDGTDPWAPLKRRVALRNKPRNQIGELLTLLQQLGDLQSGSEEDNLPIQTIANIGNSCYMYLSTYLAILL